MSDGDQNHSLTNAELDAAIKQCIELRVSADMYDVNLRRELAAHLRVLLREQAKRAEQPA